MGALIVGLLALLVLIAVTGLVVFVVYARQAMAVMHNIDIHAASDSNESLPAIRGALDDVVNVLVPSGGAR